MPVLRNTCASGLLTDISLFQCKLKPLALVFAVLNWHKIHSCGTSHLCHPHIVKSAMCLGKDKTRLTNKLKQASNYNISFKVSKDDSRVNKHTVSDIRTCSVELSVASMAGCNRYIDLSKAPSLWMQYGRGNKARSDLKPCP